MGDDCTILTKEGSNIKIREGLTIRIIRYIKIGLEYDNKRGL